MSERNPAPGTWVRHYKGGLYYVMAHGEIEATLEPVVIYRSQAPECRVWVRPLADWHKEAAPGTARFVPVNAQSGAGSGE